MGASTCVVHSTSRRAAGPSGNVLVIGYQGGVGQALLNVLADTDIGRDIVGRIDTLALIDERPSEQPSVSTRIRVLEPQRVQTCTELRSLLATLSVDQLIDLSDLDPLECMHACSQAGVDCVLVRSGKPHALALGADTDADTALEGPATETAAAVVAGWMRLGGIAGLHFVD
jgi:hypothetical protein